MEFQKFDVTLFTKDVISSEIVSGFDFGNSRIYLPDLGLDHPGLSRPHHSTPLLEHK
jgi:hypothetical protein